MAYPVFSHIHCSSRYDRSAASLEADLDNWMEHCSLITLTEINNDSRAAKMREKGWAYYNAKKGAGADECGIAWRTDTWRGSHGVARRLTNIRNPIPGPNPGTYAPTHCASAILTRVGTGHKLLVSVAHMPAKVEDVAHDKFYDVSSEQKTRKKAYLSALQGWNTHTDNMERLYKPDATMIIADWNLNLKEHWVRALLYDRFGKEYKQAWRNFPTSGGSLSGGPVVPLGAPGKTNGDRIIDGTVYRGLKVITEPNLMARVSSSDHRPYHEGFQFTAAPGKKAQPTEDDDASGDTKAGEIWWGFGDYQGDELYVINQATGGAGGEVL